jgi:hypothetical protein
LSARGDHTFDQGLRSVFVMGRFCGGTNT